MTNTYQSPASKPVFAAIAVAATFATLGLAVVAPAALSSPQASASAQAAYRTTARHTEVAILPGSIQVVGKRAKVARADSPYVPASYNVR
jgi:hypothetical protein